MSRIAEKLSRQNGPYYHGLLAQPDCSHCPLRMDTKVLPDGPVPARIAFVGEGPGKQEVGVGRGFVGPSGGLLWLIAEQTQIILKQQYGVDIPFKREDVWVSNAALCRPRKVVLSNGAVLGAEQVKSISTACCRSRLVDELRRVDPVVIVPVGSWALWSVTDLPNAKIYSYRGSRIQIELDALSCAIVTKTTRAPIKLPNAGGKKKSA